MKAYFLVLCLTEQCNLRCQYCYNEPGETRMNSSVIRDALDMGFKKADMLQVQLTGGEPFLCFNEIQSVVHMLKKYNKKYVLQIQTNGTVLSRDILSFIQQEHIAVGVSFDSSLLFTTGMREQQYGSDPFVKIIQTLRVFAEWGIKVGITCVVTNENVTYVHKLIDFLYSLGSVHSIHISVVRMIGQAKKNNISLPNQEEYKRQLEDLLAKYAMYEEWDKTSGTGITIRFFEKIKHKNNKLHMFSHCHLIKRTGCYVKTNGDIFPCASLSNNAHYLLGNAREGIDESRYDVLSSMFYSTMEKCITCPDFGDCEGACFARVAYNRRVPFDECIEYAVAKNALKTIEKQEKVHKSYVMQV